MLVDSHCHLNLLNLSAFDDSLLKVIEAAKQRGVARFLTVATELSQQALLLEYTQQFPEVWASIGLHPNEVKAETDIPTVETLTTLGNREKIIAFGETGLDYYRQETQLQKQWQQSAFVNHIVAAKQLAKPLIIHTRSAKGDTMSLLKSHEASLAGGVMHCFTEDYETAKKVLDLDFYISFSGIVTFKNAVDLQTVARKIPLTKILVETDCPYLAPVPYRGKQNLPSYVKEVAQFLAALRQEPFEALAKQTTENFNNLFKFPNGPT